MKLVATFMGRYCRKIVPILFFIFFVQGCHTPFIEVDVQVGKCAPGEGPQGPGGCQTQTAVAGGSYPGVNCNVGTQPCLNPGSTQGCRGGKKCTNVEQGAGNCVCQCQ